MARPATFAAKVAIVTGAGSGIGRAIAREFAGLGARVVLAGRRAAKLVETQQLIERDGGTCVPHSADITRASSVASLIAASAAITGRIDVLINSTGISAVTDPTSAPSDNDFSAIVETNLTSAYKLIRHTLPHMGDGGRIISIASVLALRAAPKSSAYVASKHGLIGLTKSLALDLASRGITVNAICPGWVDTDMARDIISTMAEAEGLSSDQLKARIHQRIPLGRMVEAEEIAALAAFLAGPAGAAITGQAIAMCAGSSLV